MSNVRPSSARYRSRIVATPAALDALAPAWDRLAGGLPTPLLQFDWCRAAAGALGPDETLHVVVIEDGGNPVAIAPLTLRREAGQSRLEALGHFLYEPQGFLFRDQAALRALWSALLKGRHPLALRRFPSDSAEVAAFGAAAGLAVKAPTVIADQTALVPLGADQPVEERLTSSRRATLRRKRRQAEKLGPVAVEHLAPTPDAVDALLDELFRVESSGWKGQAGTGLEQDPRLAGFYRDYARRAATRGALRVSLMRIGGETAAARLDVAWAGQLFELKIGFDERFAAVSPGQLLTCDTLVEAERRGLVAHHFLGSADDWQACWQPQLRDLVTLRAYPLTLAGGVALAGDALRRLRARVRARLAAALLAPLAGEQAVTMLGMLPL